MRLRFHLTTSLTLAALAALALALPAGAGEIDLAWDPVSVSDLRGYRIYWDTQPGPGYRNQVDVGNTLSATLTGVPECTWLHVAVKARDTEGQVSENFSNQVEGYAHPRLLSLEPSALEPDETATVVLTGGGFAPGAVPVIDGTGLQIESHSVDSCGQMTLQVRSIPGATLGWRALEVVNTDGSFGRLEQAVRVVDGPGEEPDPTDPFGVVAILPAAGSGNVDPGSDVQVVFSRPLDPSRVTAARFKIKGSGPPGRTGGKVRLASGYPRLESDGVTVTLRAQTAMAAGQRYEVFVKGGKKGVRSQDGDTLASSWTLSPGFVTGDLIETIAYGPSPDEASVILQSASQVPLGSVFVVTFSEALDASRVKNSTLKIVFGGKRRLPLANGGPRLGSDGRSVILEPAGSLPSGQTLQVFIKGGTKGVRSARGVVVAERKILVSFTTPIGSVQSLGVAE